MPRNRTGPELKDHYISSMGSYLGKVYYSLWQDVALLHVRWGEYVQLYGTNRERVELLNSTARYFFKVIHDVLLDEILLGIARLVDQPKSAGNRNMTIRVLPKAVDPCISATVCRLTDRAVEASQFCTDLRNRRIAHRDLAVVLGEATKPLEQASRAKVSDALASVTAVLNAIGVHYEDSVTYFTALNYPDGAEQLLYILDDGLKMEHLRWKWSKKREFDSKDFEIREL